MMINRKCVKQCMEGYYRQIDSKGQSTCRQCDSSCITCSGDKKTDCLICKNGSFIDQNTKLCSSNILIFLCFLLFYLISKLACHYTCKNCTGAMFDQCISCQGNRELKIVTLNEGVCKCPENSMDSMEIYCDENSTMA